MGDPIAREDGAFRSCEDHGVEDLIAFALRVASDQISLAGLCGARERLLEGAPRARREP